MTLYKLVEKGIDKVRMKHWAPDEFMKIDLHKDKDGVHLGPWGHVWDNIDGKYRDVFILLEADNDKWEEAKDAKEERISLSPEQRAHFNYNNGTIVGL